MKPNVKNSNKIENYQGGTAVMSPDFYRQLERQVACCLLAEDTFYLNGVLAVDSIKSTAMNSEVSVEQIAALAIKARHVYKLRHVPLLLLAVLAKRGTGRTDGLVSNTIAQVISRPDEMGELLSLCKRHFTFKAKTMTHALRKGLAKAFTKFDAYQLAKWNRPANYSLRDVLFLSHAKPKDEAQAEVWKHLVEGTLTSPDTWEVALSSGKNKKEVFTELMVTNKLPWMAFLQNLRNMTEANVDREVIVSYMEQGLGSSKALPFRYIAAANNNPTLVKELSNAMTKSLVGYEVMSGRTLLFVDVSGSMEDKMSAKSDLTRISGASALAVLLANICEQLTVVTFSGKPVKVPTVKDLSLTSLIDRSQPHGGTNLYSSLSTWFNKSPQNNYDRLVIITDEQSSDGVYPSTIENKYIINVGTYKPELTLDKSWVKINGFSESVVQFMLENEREKLLT